MSSTDLHSDKLPGSRRTHEAAVTLEDVARLAGVSTITVSRAINYPEKVAAKTLEKVTRAIQQTGYVPNLLAGALASRRSRLIAAIVPSIANMVYAETIQYFSSRLKQAGYQVLLGESGYPQQSEQQLISAILSRRPDGILLTGVNHSADCRHMLLGAKIPLVETWDITPTPLDIVVGFSHERIGEAVADFVVRNGFQRVGFVCADDRRAQRREKASRARLNTLGVTDIFSATTPTPTNLRLGRNGLSQLLEQGFQQGIILCSSDTLAHGVLTEAQARGLRIPQDLAILGFGDQHFAADIYPALSTVRIDRPRMGKLAAEALLARIDGQPLTETLIDVGFDIMERATT
ncbi:MAG: LacI family DNA-binding transcriptional regulator [Thiolinea sp.]